MGPQKAHFTFSAISLCLLFTLLVLELHVAIVHDGTSQLINAVLLLLSEAQHIKGILIGQALHVHQYSAQSYCRGLHKSEKKRYRLLMDSCSYTLYLLPDYLPSLPNQPIN